MLNIARMHCAGRDFNGDIPVVVGLKNSIVVDVTLTAIHPTDTYLTHSTKIIILRIS